MSLARESLVWFQKSWFWDVPGLCRAGPSLAPLCAATPGQEGAELGVLGQEAPWPRSPRKGCRAGRPSVRKAALNGTREGKSAGSARADQAVSRASLSSLSAQAPQLLLPGPTAADFWVQTQKMSRRINQSVTAKCFS